MDMILIVGGRGQGKTKTAQSYASGPEILLHLEDTVAKLYGLRGEEALDSDGSPSDRTAEVSRNPSPEVPAEGEEGVFKESASAGMSEENYWKRLCEETEETVQRILDNPAIRVITADEIGCGVVPLSRREREYRDTYGRICQKIAERADTVIRVVCGIPTVIGSAETEKNEIGKNNKEEMKN
ncbi:MAG: bifunctional adenosylcobinamide kinase/adenosylcobinamide-phosphate guanylyltransferase [[Clostridium] aminophilum]|nr:bifunctional adenosylcobinamide kinase/adenosylcobinamide-phosphate guanylyltransferase [[Clostridium] aminophilum]